MFNVVALMLKTNAMPPNLRALGLGSLHTQGKIFHGSSPFPR